MSPFTATMAMRWQHLDTESSSPGGPWRGWTQGTGIRKQRGGQDTHPKEAGSLSKTRALS